MRLRQATWAMLGIAVALTTILAGRCPKSTFAQPRQNLFAGQAAGVRQGATRADQSVDPKLIKVGIKNLRARWMEIWKKRDPEGFDKFMKWTNAQPHMKVSPLPGGGIAEYARHNADGMMMGVRLPIACCPN
mmetsp:Transcript_99152/g.196502  ORF Transcript_99152/g.196502 Transcript_99152/m.196502 type:complete len:132 (+) Transcript_99152:101-496(+)